GLWIPAQVAGHFHRGFFGMLGRSDRPADESGGEINPAVRPERRAVHAELRALRVVETREQRALLVRVAGALRVLEKVNVRRARDDEAALPRHHAIWKREAVGEDRALVVVPVALRGFEHDDATLRRLARARIAAV